MAGCVLIQQNQTTTYRDYRENAVNLISMESYLGVYTSNEISEGNQFHGNLIGSGTYYEYLGVPFLITAAHVSNSLQARLLGMVACHPISYRYRLDMECTRVDLSRYIDYSDQDIDISIYVLDTHIPSATPIDIETEYNWRLGERIVSTHSGAGVGTVEGYITWGSSRNAVELDIPAWSGASGGGVLNQEGRLIGVIYAMKVVQTAWSGREVAEGHKVMTLLPLDIESRLLDLIIRGI